MTRSCDDKTAQPNRTDVDVIKKKSVKKIKKNKKFVDSRSFRSQSEEFDSIFGLSDDLDVDSTSSNNFSIVEFSVVVL